MNAVAEGLGALLDPTVVVCLLIGLLVGTLVGAFPGVTGTMAVALASGFTLTLEPVQGLAVLLTIYVGANYGDRIPSILVNTPGTPAAIATTLDGYPLARQGKAGLALVSSSMVTTAGILLSMVLFLVAARPVASIALEFGPAEMFALVVFGLTIMISISSKSVIKGVLAGIAGLAIATVGRDPITGDSRFVFGVNDLNSGLPFIAVIIGLFGIAELFDQLLTHREHHLKPVSSLGRWWPTRSEYREMARPFGVSSVIGMIFGVVPAAGGDIAGLVGWDRAKRMSKRPEKFGKGSLEGLAAPDTASTATMGGSVTTTLALGVPGDSVMAVMLGSMIIWGLQPGPSLFVNSPDLVFSLAAIMLVATAVTLGLSLLRLQGVVKLLALPQRYLWAVIITFCMVGTFAVQNNPFDVALMLVFGILGLGMRRFGFPAGPMVLGLILGPLAESNLRRALLIDGANGILTSPIALALLALSVLAVAGPRLRAAARSRRRKTERDRDPVGG